MVPLVFIATSYQLYDPLIDASAQEVPESYDIQMFPPYATAVWTVPSALIPTLYQPWVESMEVTSVQVTPESVDVHRFPPLTPAV